MKKHAVIVAGGQGSRMQSDIPKQFLEVAGKPLLMHTLEIFFSFDVSMPLWLVLPQSEHTRWQQLCEQYDFQIPHYVVVGGSCRPESVYKGVKCINDKSCLVAVHDGVRPLVDVQLIERSFSVAEKQGSAIAAVPLKDSIREVTKMGSVSRNRADYRLMQTPQTFQLSWLLDAYDKLDTLSDFSDEASLVETAGRRVTLIEGNYQNIKVTTPEDLWVAEAFLKQKASQK
ncbi:MAG: 2-C-methyl-D-erythritol 4-phosphate cytidylyltransferase [Cyclobacteriaceae bacterium]